MILQTQDTLPADETMTPLAPLPQETVDTPLEEARWTTATRKAYYDEHPENFADPDNMAYPIKDGSDVNDAWRLAGHAAHPDAVRARIKAIAQRLGLTDALPDTAKEPENAAKEQSQTTKEQSDPAKEQNDPIPFAKEPENPLKEQSQIAKEQSDPSSLGKEPGNPVKKHRQTVKEQNDPIPSQQGMPSSPAPAPAPVFAPKPRIAQIKVKWLYDEAISLNGRQYPRESVDRLLQSAQMQLSDPQALPITCFISHEKADEDDATKMSGRVVQVWREGSDALAFIDIPDTHAGRDIATLTSTHYLNTMSLRATGAELYLDKQKSLPQVGGSQLTLRGIDFTANPGLPQARIQQVLIESVERAGFCEVFDVDLSLNGRVLEILKKEEIGMGAISEDSLPSMTSGLTIGMDGPTTSDYAKRHSDIPPPFNGSDADPLATSALKEAHDHIAYVQGRTCAPDTLESTFSKRLLAETGRMISGKNDKHLDVAHDKLARALQMTCEGADNKKPMKTVDPDNDGDAELLGYDRKGDAMEHRKEAQTSSLTLSSEMAEKLLREAGWKVERPKTREELMQEQLDQQRHAMERELAEQRKTMIAQLAEQKKALDERQREIMERELAEQRKTMAAQLAEQKKAFDEQQRETIEKELIEQRKTMAAQIAEQKKILDEQQRETMEKELAEQRKLWEAQLAEQKKALDEQMKEMKEVQKQLAAAEASPQRRSMVEGATPPRPPQPIGVYKQGDYLKEQIRNVDFNRIADRSYPLPEQIDVKRLLDEMENVYLGMYEEKWGLGV